MCATTLDNVASVALNVMTSGQVLLAHTATWSLEPTGRTVLGSKHRLGPSSDRPWPPGQPLGFSTPYMYNQVQPSGSNESLPSRVIPSCF